MSYNSKYTGQQVEDLLDQVANGVGITKETDPIFSASPAAKITDGNISTWNGKQDKVVVVDHGTGDATFELTPNKLHRWGEMASLTLTLAAPTDATIVNHYMVEFVSGATATTLTMPDTIVWQNEPNVEAGKTYQISVVDNLGVIGGW